ncbi:MAG: helix-turn-helix domain-containing protein, partial [Firmicutes bacterium]|nr:helix-turn-helix domain-containing protein [Bacillota bacterium]
MSQEEARRVYVIEQVVVGRLSISQAARLLNLSERQVKRLKKGVMEQGVAFLAHKNRGRKPKHAIPQEVRDTVIALALDPNKYKDASCQQMSELLAQ